MYETTGCCSSSIESIKSMLASFTLIVHFSLQIQCSKLVCFVNSVFVQSLAKRAENFLTILSWAGASCSRRNASSCSPPTVGEHEMSKDYYVSDDDY